MNPSYKSAFCFEKGILYRLRYGLKDSQYPRNHFSSCCKRMAPTKRAIGPFWESFLTSRLAVPGETSFAIRVTPQRLISYTYSAASLRLR
jgi:hypothetical protein